MNRNERRELSEEPQSSDEEPQAVTAGGIWTISEVQNFAKTRLRRSFTAKLYKIIAVNSAKLLGFGPLHFDLPGRERQSTRLLGDHDLSRSQNSSTM